MREVNNWMLVVLHGDGLAVVGRDFGTEAHRSLDILIQMVK